MCELGMTLAQAVGRRAKTVGSEAERPFDTREGPMADLTTHSM